MFNALFNSEIKSLGLYTYFIMQSFSTLSELRMFEMMSDLGVRQAVIRPRPKNTRSMVITLILVQLIEA